MKKLTKIIGTPINFFTGDINSMLKNSDKKTKAEEEFFDLVLEDKDLKLILEKYNVSRSNLINLYGNLINNGAGQWTRGHYVATASISNAKTLEFILKNSDASFFVDELKTTTQFLKNNTLMETVFSCLMYFERNQKLE